MTCGWTGVCRPGFRKVPSSNYRNLRSYPLLWWILAENHPFFAILRQFLDNPPLFKENLPKKGPLFREFGAQKPTLMGGTYPYLQHVMYPPPRGNIVQGLTSAKSLASRNTSTKMPMLLFLLYLLISSISLISLFVISKLLVQKDRAQRHG